MSKYIELAKKLRALAERGENGEKDNALKMLNDLMKKYDIDHSELEEIEKKRRGLKYKNNLEKRLLFGCIGKILSVSRISVYDDKRGKELFLDLSDIEFVEIMSIFNFYKTDFEKQVDAFMTAFIVRNEIFNANFEKSDTRPVLTEEQKKAMRMLDGIEKKEYFKQINQ